MVTGCRMTGSDGGLGGWWRAPRATRTETDGRTASSWSVGRTRGGAESLVSMDGLASRWEMVQRDPVLPGQMVVRDFGGGFRGVWENSNDFREAVDARFIGADRVVPGVSFEGPRMVIRTNTWNPAWTDFTSTTVFSVGDNDGNCVYFRYRDEDNWYRVTVCGENNNLDWRAPFGVTVQKRTGGVFAELAEDASIATDPSDTSFYKRVRVTVKAEGPNIEVRVAGWNAQATPPAWDEGAELVLSLNDTDHPAGRYGVGTWGQSGGGPATASNPVNAGALIEAVTVSVGGSEVFREDWLGLPLAADLPAGWERVGSGAPAGTWQVTAHGTILQTSNYSSPSTGTATSLRADGDGTVLLAPALGSAGQRLEFGFHPFDDDGIGFVYDFRDTNNYARVLFVSEATGPGRVPQGVSVSRRSGGVWSDLVAGDPGFVYANGRPFAVEFSQQRGECRLTVWNLDATGSAPAVFGWSDVPAVATNRFGFTCWGETDAHFLHARGYAMAEAPVVAAPVIRAIRFEGGVLRFEVAAADGGGGGPLRRGSGGGRGFGALDGSGHRADRDCLGDPLASRGRGAVLPAAVGVIVRNGEGHLCRTHETTIPSGRGARGWLHPHRTAGGHRDHRHPGEHAASGARACEGAGPPGELPEQHPAGDDRVPPL
jgi:hypothetical protein